MKDIKRKKIPQISLDRLDSTNPNHVVGTNKEEKTAYAFMKGKEQVQPLTLRLPLEVYQDLREYAFKNRIKINQLVVKLVKEHLRVSKT
jgi:hypothetical protein